MCDVPSERVQNAVKGVACVGEVSIPLVCCYSRLEMFTGVLMACAKEPEKFLAALG